MRRYTVCSLVLLFSIALVHRLQSQTATETVNTYSLRQRKAEEAANVLRPLIANQPGTLLQVDAAKNQIVLRGNAWVHETARSVLNRLEQNPLGSPQPAESQAVGSSPPSASTIPVRQYMGIAPGSMDQVRREMVQIFGARLQFDAIQSEVAVLATASGNLRIYFDRQRQDVFAEGPASVVSQLRRLTIALQNRSPNLRGQGTADRILMIQRDTQPKVLQSISPNPAILPPTIDSGAVRRVPQYLGLRQVAYAFSQDPATPVPQISPPTEPIPVDPQSGRPRLPQFDGVQIETLPDLDAIILRGRDAELDQLAEIIKQLEQVSRQTQASVDVIPLRFSDADQVAKLIEETQQNLIGTRQGRATVSSLSKPNAILVIGWGDAVVAIRDLITKLDQPVAPNTQFAVIQLKHAIASEVQATLQGFFSTREGLAPQIQSTADERTNSIIVHAAPRDLQEVRLLVQKLDIPQGSQIQQARVFPIKNSLAADIATTLLETIQGGPTAGNNARNAAIELLDENGRALVRSGLLENTQVTVNSRNNSLIISSKSENMGLIEELIRQLDSPGMVSKIKIFPIQNGDATSMVELLRSLLPSQSANSTGATTGASQQLSSAPGETSLAPLRFTVDTRSNNIVATGSEGDLKIVEALIFRLDESDGMQRKSMVYQLKNSPAVDVALAINEFLRNKRTVENAAPGQVNPFEQLEKEVVVVPEPVANKLILSATPRYYEEVSQLIQKLDEQPPQVMIQVMIAEVALGDADEFGVELGLQDSVLFDRSLLGGLVQTRTRTTTTSPGGAVTTVEEDNVIAATNNPGFNFNSKDPLGNSGSSRSLQTRDNVGGQGISNFSVGRTNNELGFGGLVLSASSQNVSFLLRALQECRRLEVLSRPQVLTLDNQPAFIQVGQRVPRILNSNTNPNGQTLNTTVLENVGLIVGVTPRISPEGNVVMEIDAEKSALGPETEGIPISITPNGTVIRSPRIDVTTAQATVSAANGETIILGGLISKTHNQIHRKVPFLGDIPLINRLFRYDYEINRRTELLIILTPRVIRGQEDMERIKQTEFARMSWCAADVINLHGDLQWSPHAGPEITDGEGWDVIFPDADPRGQGTQPTGSNRTPKSMLDLTPARNNSTTPPVQPAVEPQLARSGNNPMWQPTNAAGPNSSLSYPSVPAGFDSVNASSGMVMPASGNLTVPSTVVR